MERKRLITNLEEISSYLDAKAVGGNKTWHEWAQTVDQARATCLGETPTIKTFGRFIRKARLNRGWTQTTLSAESGYGNHASLCHLEKGDLPQGPSLRTMISLLDALGYELRIVKKS